MLKQLKEIALEVIVAILPISLAVIILQLTVINISTSQFFQFLTGFGMCILGMVLFLLGVKTGLLPIGEAIGSELPKRGSLLLLVATAFLIGFAVTVAEPDVIVLTGQIDEVSKGSISENILINVIAIGIGFFVAVAMLRIVFGFPIKYLFAAGYAIVLILSFFVPPEFVPVAFDAGGVTTGPMTVPVILSLGIGLSSVLAGRSAISDGFGLIGLASIGPIIGVMIMGIILR
ncbi:MAG: DUF1538 domain-containing protein [Chloroflexi bacterium]|nr:DUF1538 domain-containing protein [Chloroflexota bacterium]MBM4452122.1 DUF1538 domain-containing protein [Chloroflexota bacterium]